MSPSFRYGPRDEFGPLPTGERPAGPAHGSLPTQPAFPRYEVIDSVAVVTIPVTHFEALTAINDVADCILNAADEIRRLPETMDKALKAWNAAFGTPQGEAPSNPLEQWSDAFPGNRPFGDAGSIAGGKMPGSETGGVTVSATDPIAGGGPDAAPSVEAGTAASAVAGLAEPPPTPGSDPSRSAGRGKRGRLDG